MATDIRFVCGTAEVSREADKRMSSGVYLMLNEMGVEAGIDLLGWLIQSHLPPTTRPGHMVDLALALQIPKTTMFTSRDVLRGRVLRALWHHFARNGKVHGGATASRGGDAYVVNELQHNGQIKQRDNLHAAKCDIWDPLVHTYSCNN
mmetsp:Transcript_54027/g.127576  ORF Transcript_54027/g.127576 Transcript_54027/m.127576 type:complete len:148 (+) Transcript_54027:2-445(+)